MDKKAESPYEEIMSELISEKRSELRTLETKLANVKGIFGRNSLVYKINAVKNEIATTEKELKIYEGALSEIRNPTKAIGH